MADRIQARAIHRCGVLLKEIEKAKTNTTRLGVQVSGTLLALKLPQKPECRSVKL